MVVRMSKFASGDWQKKFEAYLNDSSGARDSVRILESHGIDSHLWLNFLYRYTCSAFNRLQPLRNWTGRIAQSLSKIEVLSRKLADDLEKGLPGFQMGGLTAWQSSKECAAIESLRSAAEYAGDLRKHYKEISCSKGKNRNEEILVDLCLQIEAQTGSPHWSDIAYLLEAAFSAQGQDEHWDSDRLRNIVNRFKKSSPDVYQSMRSFIFDRHSSGSKTSSAVKRSTRNRRNNSRPSQMTIHRDLSGRQQ